MENQQKGSNTLKLKTQSKPQTNKTKENTNKNLLHLRFHITKILNKNDKYLYSMYGTKITIKENTLRMVQQTHLTKIYKKNNIHTIQ